jgi:hypothetical protein
MNRPAVLALTVALALAATPQRACAWGATGHRTIGVAAAKALPPEIPGFLRTPAAAVDLGELARELDRSKAAGKIHDTDRDPAHFVDLDDQGRVLGGPLLSDLPPTRADYETALRAAGTDSWKAGYLPYAIVDQQQQLTKDFAQWRVLRAAERQRAWRRHRAWFAADRRRREAEIMHTLGALAHLVGDGSQPLHVSAHYNGWGDYPNPKGYTTAKVHGPIEGAFVRNSVSEAAVRADLAPLQVHDGPVERQVADYLMATGRQVEPLYALEKAGGFSPGDRRGAGFVTERLAAGASEFRDLIVEAWRASAHSQVGWPAVGVADVEAGRVDPFESLYGQD